MVVIVDTVEGAPIGDEERPSGFLSVVISCDPALSEAEPDSVDEDGTEVLEVVGRGGLLGNVEGESEQLSHAERFSESDQIGTDTKHLWINTGGDPHLADGGGVSANRYPSVVFETDDTGHWIVQSSDVVRLGAAFFAGAFVAAFFAGFGAAIISSGAGIR